MKLQDRSSLDASDSLKVAFEKLVLVQLPNVIELINWDNLFVRCKESGIDQIRVVETKTQDATPAEEQ